MKKLPQNSLNTLKPQKLNSMVDYFDRDEVSNSDLSALKTYLEGGSLSFEGLEHVFYFGNLFDAILTEKHKIDFTRKLYNGEPVDPKLFNLAMKMKNSFLKDQFARYVAGNARTQTILVDDVNLEVNNYPFTLRMRCKLDFDLIENDLVCDLKSTGAASEEQFLSSILKFDYDRQAAVYMTLAKVSRFGILGVSKKNAQLFKILITKDSELYNSGMEKFKTLAFKWHLLFN
jgi:hypothetical protein